MKLAYFDAYLSQTLWNQTKFSEKGQTANFSDLTRQRQEICAENAKKHQTRGTKTRISQKFEKVWWYLVKIDVQSIPNVVVF